MTDSEEETALRLFLEQAVPHLDAPVQRIRQVRGRVRRRRRRRTAVAAAAAVVAIAALTTLLHPGSGTTRLTPAAGSSLTVSPTTVPTPPPRVARLGDVGVTLPLPYGWSAAGDYVANRPLPAAQPCRHTGEYACPPLTRLPDGTVLVYFESIRKPHAHDVPWFSVGPPQAPDAACRALGGDSELLAVAAPHGDHELVASLCARHAPVATVKYAELALRQAVFDSRLPAGITFPPTSDPGH